MAEALFVSLTQKLENLLPTSPDSVTSDVLEDAMSELRVIMDFVRDNKLEEGSRLSYFISDLADLAQQFLDYDERQGIYVELNYIIFWLRKVKKHVLRFGADESGPTTGSEATDRDNGNKEDGVVVGLEEDLQRLLDTAIFNEPSDFRSLEITGMVGSGKTTLAREIYNHAEVVDRFDRRAWICVSGDLSYKELLMNLIEQVGAADCGVSQRDLLFEEMNSADNQSLRRMLHQRLHNKSYLIIVDDLPKFMSLKPIFKGFPNEGKGCRMVATTRYQWVLLIDGPGEFHRMETFDSDNCWKLFLKTLFRGNEITSDDEFPKQFEKKMRDILVTECGSVPLVIKEVGWQMAKKRRLGVEWEELVESIDFSPILDLLEVSYQDFDLEVKLSFMHLAFFRENTVMRRDKLFHIWATAGLVPDPWTDYACCLNLESLIELQERSLGFGHKSCSVNAIMHKLSIRKAEEEIGFEILSSKGNNRPSRDPRHRVVICSREKYNYFTNQDEHLVSLFFHGGGYFDASPSYWKSLELLRILDWEDFGLKILPEGIGALMELRYLGLRNNYFQELPDSLGCLEKLEVLDIAENFMVEVPDIIWKMASLRRLHMSDIICRKPLKIEALQNLETLSYISVHNWTYELSRLQMMTRLKTLGIEEVHENLDVSKLFATLAELKDLQLLSLRGFRFRRMPCLDELGVLRNITRLKLDGLLPVFPVVENFPPKIEELYLVNSRLDEDPMPVLEKLSKLTDLILRNAYTGRQMVISRRGFRRLRYFNIERLRNLRDVQVGEGAIRKLRTLTIKNCPYLETLPEEMSSMTELHQLTMVTTTKIARKIHKTACISKIKKVEINP